MTPITNFSTAQDIKNILDAIGESTGIFDDVTITPGQFTYVSAFKNNEKLLEVTNSSGWTLRAFIASNTYAQQTFAGNITEGYLCKQALFLKNSNNQHCVITVGNNGKCVTIIGSEASMFSITTQSPYKIYCIGDNTSLTLYTTGYRAPGYFSSSSANDVADKTQLITLPITGETGSTDYVVGAKMVYMRQFSNQGTIIINGKKYYCLYRFALLDE